MDAVVAGIEGARRLGFVIENMRDAKTDKNPDNKDFWLDREIQKEKDKRKKYSLTYS